MFAQLNSRIKLPDLLRGIIVQSGNDAASAAAEAIGGSESGFARRMNERAREIGLSNSVFTNATGYSDPEQKVTARDMALLAAHLIETYPEEYKIFTEREFTWNKIRQQNRNPLLAMNIGSDGLKTGYLRESGYALTASAVQNGQRLILVVSGLKTMSDRANEARKLLEWGFRSFEPRQLFAAREPAGEARVYGGDRRSVPLVSKKPVRLRTNSATASVISVRVMRLSPGPAAAQGRSFAGGLTAGVPGLPVPMAPSLENRSRLGLSGLGYLPASRRMAALTEPAASSGRRLGATAWKPLQNSR